MSDIKGCTNHGCLVSPLPKGAMGTNAICQCMRDPVIAQRVAHDRLRLLARVAELETENRLYSEYLANATQEIERLQELLRPAAAFADVLDSDEIFEEMREPETIIATLDDAVLTAADCYAARAALEGKG